MQCIYDCFRVGMQPALVLNEEEKKERFKVYIEKKKRYAKAPIQSPLISSSNIFKNLQSTCLSSAVSSCQTFRPERFPYYDNRPILSVAPKPKFSSRPLTTSPMSMFSTEHADMSTKLDKIPPAPLTHSPSIYSTTFPPCKLNVNQLPNCHQNKLNWSRNSVSPRFIANNPFIQPEDTTDIKDNNMNDVETNCTYTNPYPKIQVNQPKNNSNTSDDMFDTSQLEKEDSDNQLILNYINTKFGSKKAACFSVIDDFAEEPFKTSSEIISR